MTPRVFRSVKGWLRFRRSLKGTLGFVPTMGALHEGHLSLVRRSRRETDRTLVSIFVNPTQFDDPKDLAKYPRTLAADLRMLGQARADYVLRPAAAEFYPDRYRYRVAESELSRVLCGAHRPGHFDGVLTVVMKLLNVAQADRAYFGEKDYQQMLLVRGMVEAFFMRTQIVPCPLVRERDGLAMSSRNARLSPEERRRAIDFPRLLRSRRSPSAIRKDLERLGFEVDYIEDRLGRRLGAVRIGAVRLIDNVACRRH